MCKRSHTCQMTQSYPIVYTVIADGEFNALLVTWLRFSLRTCCCYMCRTNENIKKTTHTPNNVITMWPCSDLSTHSLRVRQSKCTKQSHTCVWKGTSLCWGHINRSNSYMHSTSTQTDSHMKSKTWRVLKTQRFKGTQKDAHTSPHIHTQRAVGILWLNLFMLQFLEKTALKAAHRFCMKEDDWNWSASLYFCLFSLWIFFFFNLLSFSIYDGLKLWHASNMDCSLCLSYFLLFYISLALLINEPLNLWRGGRSRRETGKTDSLGETCFELHTYYYEDINANCVWELKPNTIRIISANIGSGRGQQSTMVHRFHREENLRKPV